MSVGLTFESKNGWFRNIKTNELNIALHALSTQLDFTLEASGKSSFMIQLCPDGFFIIECAKGRLHGEIITSVAGPGFHHACVVFLDELCKILKISMKVDDETNYYHDRDFASLRREMHNWLKLLATHIVDSSGSNRMVCWDISTYHPESEELVAAPRGLLDPAMVELYVKNDRFQQFGDLFWTWSSKIKDAYFYRGCALSIMWKDVIWRKPETEQERDTILRAIECLKTASCMDRSICLPIIEWQELCLLAGVPYEATDHPELKFPTIIGYRRNMLTYTFPCEFVARLPGSFKEQSDDDGTPVYYDGNRTFRLSILSVKGKEGSDFRNDMRLSAGDIRDSKSTMDFISNDCRYMAGIGKASENNEEYNVLIGQIGTKDKLAIVTICWTDERDEAWAIEAFRSVRHGNEEAAAT